MLQLLNNDRGMRLLNDVKFRMGRLEVMKGPFRQAHAAFAFLLDYVPNWKWAYGRSGMRGLIQHQLFLPAATAHDAYVEVIARGQRNGFVPYLAVFKRHRPDPFWLTHSLDGWSLALDFKVTPENREALWKHCAELTEIALAAGGKFYFAKDLVLRPGDVRRMLPAEKVAAFEALKREVDPDSILQTDLYRRAFGPG